MKDGERCPPGRVRIHAAGLFMSVLVEVHKLYRQELRRLRARLEKMSASPDDQALPAGPRAFSWDSLRRNIHVHCLRFCEALTAHHTVEDSQMFPQLRHYSSVAEAVIDRLVSEHERIAVLVASVERKVGDLSADPSSVNDLAEAVVVLANDLETHLDNEESCLASLFGLRNG